jgi:hypothetical protein
MSLNYILSYIKPTYVTKIDSAFCIRKSTLYSVYFGLYVLYTAFAIKFLLDVYCFVCVRLNWSFIYKVH